MPTSTGGSSSGAGDPGAAIRAGVQLQLRGDHDGAGKAFQEALDSDDPDHAPEAGLHLAGLLGKDGDLPGAAKAYERAITSNHPDHAPRAAVELAELLVRLKLDAEAKPLFEFALASAHHDNSPRAALQLGRLLERTGDATGAQQSYQHAVDSGHPYLAPPAAMRLGELLRSAGDSTGARRAFQLVLDSHHPDHADEAAAQLRGLPPEEQPSPPPEAARPVAAAEAPVAASVPTINSAPLQATGRPDERERVWRELAQGIAARNVESVETASRYGQLLLRQNDPAGARRAYRLAAESGHWEHGPAAALQLGQLLIDSGDSDGASKAYQSALDSNHPDHAPSAAVRLGVLLTDKGDPDGARGAYEQAIGSAHPDYKPDALCRLGAVLARNGDIAGARRAYEQAIESGHPHHCPRAMVELGKALSASGDSAGACVAFERAIATGHPEHAPAAALGMGRILSNADENSATLGGIQAPSRGPLLPILQPLDWEHTLEVDGVEGLRRVQSIALPLRLVGRDIGFVALGREFGTGFEMQPMSDGIDLGAMEAEAHAGLKAAGLSWQPFAWGEGDDGDEPIDVSDVLECCDHPVAASGVLDPDFLRAAQRRLGCRRLVLALPGQDALWVAPADLPADRLDTFARMAEAWFARVVNPVTPLVFYATDGIVDGIDEESESLLAARPADHGDADGELAGFPDAPTGPLVPVLQPLDWERTHVYETENGAGQLHSIALPLQLGGRDVGFLAFGREFGPGGMVIESLRDGIDVGQFESAALANLQQIDLGWQPIVCAAPADGDGEVEAWICNDTPFASSGVLDRSLLQAAHLQTGCTRLVVAFPSREVLLVASAEAPAANVATFARLMARWYHNGDRPISHLTFYCTDGVLERVYEGSDRALEEVENSDIDASIILAFLGDPPPAGGLLELADSIVSESLDRAAQAFKIARPGLATDAPGVATQPSRPTGFQSDQDGAALFDLGMRCLEVNDFVRALTAFQAALATGHAHYAPEAAEQLGILRQQGGDIQNAKQAFRRAIELGPSDAQQRSVAWLGMLLNEEGDVEGAVEVWRLATDPSRPMYALSLHNLGVALSSLRDIEGARDAFTRAAQSDDAEFAPLAAVTLGRLLMINNDVPGARQALDLAIGFNHPDHSSNALADLGQLLKSAGDADGAHAAFTAAVDSGHPAAAPRAGINLAGALFDRGDNAGAERAYQRAMDFRNAQYEALAAEGLGRARERLGDVEGAQRAFQHAIDLGRSDAGQRAANWLGYLLYRRQDFGGAVRAFFEVTDPGHMQYPTADNNLRIIATSLGDGLDVRQAFRRAAESEDPDVGPRACYLLGTLLKAQLDFAGARAAFARAVASGHPEHDTRAHIELGLLLFEDADVAGARAAFEHVVAAGHPETAPFGAVELGRLLAGKGDREGAKQAFQLAIDASHTEYSASAAQQLGRLLAAVGQVGDDAAVARTAFEQAVEQGTAETAPVAAFNLGVLLTSQGDHGAARRAYQIAVDSGHKVYADKAAAGLRRLSKLEAESAAGDAQPAPAAEPETTATTDWAEHDPATIWRALENLATSRAEGAAYAAESYAFYLIDRKDFDGARRAFRLAVAAGGATPAPAAMLGLADACLRMGDLPGARDACKRTMELGDAAYAAAAAHVLGAVLVDLKDPEGAKQAFRKGIDSDHPVIAADSAEELGLILKAEGDPEGAKQAFQSAIDVGSGPAVQRAAYWLGEMLAIEGDYAAARDALVLVVDPDLAMYPAAAHNLGVSLEVLGDLEEARKAFRRAQDTGDEEMTQRAKLSLRRLANK